MYYLDFHGLYKQTTATSRRNIRKEINRDEMMAYRLKLQKNQCFYCCEPVTMQSHLDHIIPVYYGGTNVKANLVAACKSCNVTKMTDQIEITNPYTIADYLKLQDAYRRWLVKVSKYPNQKRYQPKRVMLYNIYRADLFKKI